MFWERASLALPAPLLSALRAGELTDPRGVLSEYPRVVCEGALLHTGGEAGGRRRSFFMDYLFCVTFGVDGSFVYVSILFVRVMVNVWSRVWLRLVHESRNMSC